MDKIEFSSQLIDQSIVKLLDSDDLQEIPTEGSTQQITKVVQPDLIDRKSMEWLNKNSKKRKRKKIFSDNTISMSGSSSQSVSSLSDSYHSDHSKHLNQGSKFSNFQSNSYQDSQNSNTYIRSSEKEHGLREEGSSKSNYKSGSIQDVMGTSILQSCNIRNRQQSMSNSSNQRKEDLEASQNKILYGIDQSQHSTPVIQNQMNEEKLTFESATQTLSDIFVDDIFENREDLLEEIKELKKQNALLKQKCQQQERQLQLANLDEENKENKENINQPQLEVNVLRKVKTPLGQQSINLTNTNLSQNTTISKEQSALSWIRQKRAEIENQRQKTESKVQSYV